MGKSYKRTPVLKSKESRVSKKKFNRSLRRNDGKVIEISGSYYKKLNNSYDICDERYYIDCTLDDYVRDSIRSAVKVHTQKIEFHRRFAERWAFELDRFNIWEDDDFNIYWLSMDRQERYKKYRNDVYMFRSSIFGGDWQEIRREHNRIVEWYNSNSSKMPSIDLRAIEKKAIRNYKKYYVSK